MKSQKAPESPRQPVGLPPSFFPPTLLRRLVPLAALLALLGLVSACSDDSGSTPEEDGGTGDIAISPDTEPPNVVDIRGDLNRDGVVDLTDPDDDTDEESWDKTHGVIFLANMDDDDNSCPKNSAQISDMDLAACFDAADEAVDGDDDLKDMARLKTAPWAEAPDDASGQISLSLPGTPTGDAWTYVHLFKKDAAGFTLLAKDATLDAATLRQGVELAVEGRDIVRDSREWDGYVDVTFSVQYTEGGQAVTKDDTLRMRVAPVLTSHHLQGVEFLFASSTATPSSVVFRQDLEAAFKAAGGTKFVPLNSWDQWTQDVFETGWMAMPAANGKQHVIKVFLRSANVDAPKDPVAPLRDAGRVVYDMRGPDVAAIQQVDLTHDGMMDSLNSLGNLETIPPYDNAGESFPMGRMIMGNVETFHPDPRFTRMLEAQAVQKPLWIDTSWLLVGHTDETISFVKADSPRGWKLVLNDPTMARQMLQDAADAGHGEVVMFEGKKWLDDSNKEYSAAVTINQVLADSEVMGESAKAQVEVDKQLALLKQATGITDDEIIHIPYLHWPVDGYSVAFNPGTVNSALVAVDHFAAPETHGPVINGEDIFKKQLTDIMTANGITVHYVENWDLYHRLLGEVHCGSNVLRVTPEQVRWWEAGR